MSMEVANATDLLGQFASNNGYAELIAAGKKHPVLDSLFRNGASEDVPAAVKALLELAEEDEVSEDVVKTARDLAYLINGEELIVVTDGTSEEAEIEKAADGVMVAWFPPKDLAKKLVLEDGEDVDQLHVTILYLGKVGRDLTEEQVGLLQEIVKAYASRFAPMEGTLGGRGRFPATPSSDDKDVLITMADVPLLEKFREGLIAELAKKGLSVFRNHGYTPHMTLAYVDPDFEGVCEHPDTFDIELDALTVTVGDKHEKYPLSGEKVLKGNPTPSDVHVPIPLGEDESRKAWKVTWADGRGVVYFKTRAAADKFYSEHVDDAEKPELVEAPAGARIRKDASGLEAEFSVQKLNTCHVPSGPHGGEFCETGGLAGSGFPSTSPVSVAAAERIAVKYPGVAVGIDPPPPDKGEHAAMGSYKSQGYKAINSFLLGTPGFTDNPKYRKEAEDLGRVIRRSTLESDATLYRGMSGKPAVALSKLPVGSEFSIPCFQSTSASLKTAVKFADEGGRSPVVFKIQAPKGTQALPIEKFAALKAGSEREMVLNSGLRYRVVGKKEEYLGVGKQVSYKVLTLEVLQ